MRIEVKASEGIIKTYSPYSKRFVDFAHMRNAKWSDSEKCWMFDPRDEFAVRSALIDIYGTDDYSSCEKVDVRVKMDEVKCTKSLFMLGRELARRKYRDYYVDLGEGVAVIQGGFPDSGGSARYPELNPEEGTILEVRGVPKSLAEREWLENRSAVELVGDMDQSKLEAEKERLLKRIEEIDRLLAELNKDDEGGDVIADLQDDDDGTSETSR
jgi:hypothetical protein